MTATIIDGKAFAAQVRGQVAQHVTRLKDDHGITPGLAVVLVGADPASEVYVKSKGKMTKEVGMKSVEHRLAESTSEAGFTSRPSVCWARGRNPWCPARRLAV